MGREKNGQVSAKRQQNRAELTSGSRIKNELGAAKRQQDRRIHEDSRGVSNTDRAGI